MENDAADGVAAAETAAAGAPTGRLRGVVGVVALIVALDQATKAWAVSALGDGPVSIIGDTVELRLTRNPGGAFGRFQGMTPLLAVCAIVVSVLLTRAVRRAPDRWMLAGLVLVLGGAVGNLVDRIARSPGFLTGRVVDFVSVGWWPVFNVADSCISIGAVLLVLRGWAQHDDPEPDHEPGAEPGTQPRPHDDAVR